MLFKLLVVLFEEPEPEPKPKPAMWNVLSLALLFVFAAVQKSQNCDTFHHTSCGVTQELATRLEGAIDANVVLGGHEKVARLRRVMRSLF